MKKIICLLCSGLLLLSVVSCGKNSGAPKESVVKKTVEQNEIPQLTQTSLKTPAQYENGGVKAEITGISYEEVVTKIHLHLNNGTENPLRFSTLNLSVNGLMCSDHLFLEVPAYTEQDGFVEISNRWFADMGISAIKEAELTVKVYDQNNDEVMSSGVLKIETDASKGYKQKIDDGGLELYSGNGTKLSVRSLQKSALSDDMELTFYCENNTNSAISVMSADVLVNGKVIEPTFVISVGAGKKAVDTMVFHAKDLQKAEISDITDISASFKAFNENLETVFETETVKIPIAE